MQRRKPAPVIAYERAEAAFALAVEGFSSRDIAARLGWADASSAWRAIMEAASRRPDQAERAESWREMQLERIDRLIKANMGAADEGDEKAADVILKAITRQAKLLGLDHADGIAERQVRLAEGQAALIVALISQVIDDGELGLSPEQRERARSAAAMHLRLAAG